MPDLSVILVSYNTLAVTKKALDHLFASDFETQMEVIVIDNNSDDDSVEVLRRDYPQITLIANQENVGFGRANNQALSWVRGRYLLLLNTDAFVEADTIGKTVKFMDENPNCGVLGVKLLGGNGKLQASCRYFPTPWNLFLNLSGLERFFRPTVMVDDLAWDLSLIHI